MSSDELFGKCLIAGMVGGIVVNFFLHSGSARVGPESLARSRLISARRLAKRVLWILALTAFILVVKQDAIIPAISWPVMMWVIGLLIATSGFSLTILVDFTSSDWWEGAPKAPRDEQPGDSVTGDAHVRSQFKRIGAVAVIVGGILIYVIEILRIRPETDQVLASLILVAAAAALSYSVLDMRLMLRSRWLAVLCFYFAAFVPLHYNDQSGMTLIGRIMLVAAVVCYIAGYIWHRLRQRVGDPINLE